jgi:hypothetical protein
MEQNDYVIFRDDKGRHHLVQVTSKDNRDEVTGILERDRAYDPKSVSFERSAVVASLGPDPVFGTAYGCKVEPYQNTRHHRFWGDVHFFRKLEPIERKAIKIALDEVAETLTKLKLTDFAPLDVEIKPASGRYAGSYKYTGKDDVRDLMKLHPKSFVDPMSDESMVRPKAWTIYLLMHEAAHGIWYRMVPNSIKARWIKAYHSTVVLKSTSADVVQKLGRQFTKAQQHFTDFRSELPEEHCELFDACLTWIKNYHSLSQHNLNVLVEAQDFELLGTLWPTEELLDTDHEIPLGEYASKNVEETFAEAFALYYAAKIKIPKQFETLLLKTVQKIRR